MIFHYLCNTLNFQLLAKMLNYKISLEYTCMEIRLSEVFLCVTVFVPYYSPWKGGRMWTLSSEYKLTKLIFLVLCPPHNLTSEKKSSLIHMPSAQISRAFNQHDTARKTVFRYKNNIGKSLILLQDAVINIYWKHVSCTGRRPPPGSW